MLDPAAVAVLLIVVAVLLVVLVVIAAAVLLRLRRRSAPVAEPRPSATSASTGRDGDAGSRTSAAGSTRPSAPLGPSAVSSASQSRPGSASRAADADPVDPDPAAPGSAATTQGATAVLGVASSAAGTARPVTDPAPGRSMANLSSDGSSELVADAEQRAEEIRAEADKYRKRLRARAEAALKEAQEHRDQTEQELTRQQAEARQTRLDLERREQRVADREHRLDAETHLVHQKLQELDESRTELAEQAEAAAQAEAARIHELERVAGLTADQARAELVTAVEQEAKRHAVILARDIESTAQREAEQRARSILVGAIQRLASEQTSESVVAAIHLPSDEMKGRIIGREGRNIRSFEQVTGVNVLIDDTPESVLLSCFDPVRREAARITLTELIEDGRIHPVRIEEVHERSKAKIAERCLRAAEDALAEVGITDLHPELVTVLGTLRYRTSYGQNVLRHSVECAHLAGMMAAELGLDVALCKRSAFLHDIGKALTHEVEGSHALIGADLARKYGEHPDVVHAIEAHHNEVEPHTVEAVLTQAADAISGSRPGARRESLEAYVQRLERLEEIALAHEGVEKVFAMQAGREVRVMVTPDVVDDIAAQVLARDIVKQVEEELTYPGQIRVTVVRESRAVETAR
ncbi:ribonuclease Y [Friedmanniella endophytica]|uniref:Ribonuclease Y n=1 Tax=Microlunatus kandeliicorticis TaxID=1759536 RepID=A0A7W3IUD4_9ACTN|nr:ribonuclease Y [Microlunatus kandeliicorticis]MBA8795423.1 ribonuclease Y [Microlunatus kandeliicorticis]